MAENDDDDVWYNKEKLYADHIKEVLAKWDNIDDEIWAKIIVLERNRRVAKAYARAPVLTINGSDDGFDGFRIGVAGFDNPMRDAATDDTIRRIGQGFKLKMDDLGNILIKRLCRATAVRIRNVSKESAVSNDIVLKMPNGVLEPDKPFKVFDMKKFQQNMNRELKRPIPDRNKLEGQCISVISFGNQASDSNDPDLLDCPIWILVINIVAMEMLRAKLPPQPVRMQTAAQRYRTQSGPAHASMRPFGSGSSDEDPYSVAGSGSSGSSGNNIVHHAPGRAQIPPPGKPGNQQPGPADKPPKLPPRDTAIYGPTSWWSKGPFDPYSQLPGHSSSSSKEDSRKKVVKKTSGGEDPYYWGLRARIPNFVKSRNKSSKKNGAPEPQMPLLKSKSAGSALGGGRQEESPYSLPPHPFWWHNRMYHQGNNDPGQMSLATETTSVAYSSNHGGAASNGAALYQRNPNPTTYVTPGDRDSSDSDYSHLYGRGAPGLAGNSRAGTNIRKFPAKPLFMSQWE